jgi:hypothetical protein
MALAACSNTSLLPRESKTSSASFQTYEQVQSAYDEVKIGITRTPDLAPLGFDVATGANAETLTHIGLGDRFLVTADGPASHVPPAVQACLKTQTRCAAQVFHLQRLKSNHTGNVLMDATGFERNVVDTGWTAEVMLVLQDGVVVYKIMSGRPHIEVDHDVIQPLGILQNMGKPKTDKKTP